MPNFQSYRTQTFLLMGVLIFLGLCGITGGLAMVSNTHTAGVLHLSPTLLKSAPVHSYFWPGLFLLGILGLIPLATSFEIWIGERHAWLVAFTIGVLLTAWLTYQILLIGFNPLQVVFFIVAFVIMGLSLNVRR